MDEKESTAETLRRVIPMLRQHASDFGPISYQLWFEYAQQSTPWLGSVLDTVCSRGVVLNTTQTSELFRRLTEGTDPLKVDETRNAVSALLGQVAATTAAAQERTAQYGDHLDEAVRAIEQGDTAAGADLLLSKTRDFSSMLTTFNNQLQAARAESEELKAQLDAVRSESRKDPLTGLANRRVFDEVVKDHLAKHVPLVLLMFDLDHFKKIKDTHGHLFGDQVLRAFAGILQTGVTATETACRIGGEEFVLVLPSSSLTEALERAEAIRQRIGSAKIRKHNVAEPLGGITVSCGMAIAREGDTPVTLFERADKALYRSKANGRNCVTEG